MDIVRRLWLLRNALWSGTAPLTRQLLDALATATVVIVLAGIGARTYDASVARTQIAEALSLSRNPMTTAALHYAQYGTWPEPDESGTEDEMGRYVERVDVVRDGRVRFWFVPDAHPLVRGRYGTTAPIVGGDGATLRWQVVDNGDDSDNTIDPSLLPYAWRLDPKEP